MNELGAPSGAITVPRVTFRTKWGDGACGNFAEHWTTLTVGNAQPDYEGVIELHVLVKQLLPFVCGNVCCCELVVDLHDDRLTTSSSVVKSSCNTDGLMY